VRRRLACLAGVLALLAAGCNGGGDPGEPGAPIRLGAVLPTFAHPFFIAQKDGLERAAKDLGVAIDVRDGQDDDRKQIEQVETLLTLGVDALVLCPRDQDAAVRAVEQANADGVPVVALNRRVSGGKVVAYVGADDREAGRQQAKALLDALGPDGGSILYLQGTQGSSPQVRRAEGFREALAGHPEIKVADERYCDFQADEAKAAMTVLAQRFGPGEVRAVVAQSDEMALPAAEVARAQGWGDVVVIGCDGTKAAFDAIRRGTLTATVLQDAADQGERAVRAAVAHLRGEPVPAEEITPLPVVTRANVDELEPSY
jgi:ribose transport system substrate-binding protein